MAITLPCPKPVPLITASEPIFPLLGLNRIRGDMVYVAEILPPAESLAMIVWTCPFDSGIAKLASNLPFASDATLRGVVVSVAESKVSIICEVGENPAPLAVTTVPTVPDVDERVSFEVIVNVATLCKPFESWARTLQPPIGLFGATKEAVKAPY